MFAATARAGSLAGLLAFCSFASGEALDPSPLHLRWCDPHGLLESGWASVGKELSRFFGKAGVAVTLTRDGEDPGIRVVLVRSEPDQWGLPLNTLGAVLSQSGPQSEVYVFFPTLARVLGYRPEALSKRWPTAREERALLPPSKDDGLGSVPQDEFSQLHQVFPTLNHGQEMVSRERAHLTREPAASIDEQDLGLAEAPGIEQNVAPRRMARRVLESESGVEVPEGNPDRFPAPARVNDLVLERKESAKRLAGRRRHLQLELRCE